MRKRIFLVLLMLAMVCTISNTAESNQFTQVVEAQFTEYTNNMAPGIWPDTRFIELDLEADGDMDVIMFSTGNEDHINFITNYQQATIFRNLGPNGWVKEKSGIYGFWRDYEVADFNRDGLDDIVLIYHGYDYHPFPGAQDSYIIQTPNGQI